MFLRYMLIAAIYVGVGVEFGHANSPQNQSSSQAEERIQSAEQAIDILHTAVNGRPISPTEFDMDTIRVVQGRESFIYPGRESIKLLIQKGYIYTVTWFSVGGDYWIEEYKAKLRDLNEWDISITIQDQYYKLNQEPEICIGFLQLPNELPGLLGDPG